MKQGVIAGVVLGVMVAVWTLIMGVTGWYKHPVGAAAFFLVVPINIGVVIWALMKTKQEGRGYGGQVAVGVVLGIVGAILIFFNSLLFTQVLFPTYFEDLRTMQAELLRNAGQSEEAIQERLDGAAASQTPLGQATAGVIGTFATTLVTTLVAAFFIRAKDSPVGR